MKKVFLTTLFIILSMSALSRNTTPSLKFNILGINEKLLAAVTERLQLKQDAIKKYDSDSINIFYQNAPREISKELELYGYFKSTVTSLPLSNKKNIWEQTFKVNPGPPLIIDSVDLKILGPKSTNKNILQKLNNFPLKKGGVFQTNKYNDAKQFLFELADRHGYINAFLEKKEVQIDLENNTANIILYFNTKQQYYFGNTTFDVPFFSKSFLKKFITYKQGESYSNKKLFALQDSLSSSNFFQNVVVNPQTTKIKSDEIPIEVVLTLRKPRQYNLGVGIGTDTGIRASLGVEMRRLTPYGHSLKGWLQTSQIQNNLELHYLIPGKKPLTDLFDFNLAMQTLSLDNGNSSTGQAGIGYVTVLKGWRQTIKISLQHERYKLTDHPYTSSTMLLPSINWLHTKSDDQIKPTKGHSVSINIQGTKDDVFSATSFFQSQIDAKYIKSVSKKIQVLLHGVLGFTEINDIDNLPLSLQFYTGGTQTIRGFGYNTIGPGRNLAVGSVEARHQIIGDWYLTAFFDAGNASNDLLIKPNIGTGGGIVWRTGIGTIELTFAKAISQPGTPGRIQFNFGAEL